jgi:hypothetical protein
MIMARAWTATTPGHFTSDGGLAGATKALHRMLFDSCEVVRVLGRLPGEDARRTVAIESERARAAELATRCRENWERWILATMAGVLDSSPPE